MRSCSSSRSLAAYRSASILARSQHAVADSHHGASFGNRPRSASARQSIKHEAALPEPARHRSSGLIGLDIIILSGLQSRINIWIDIADVRGEWWIKTAGNTAQLAASDAATKPATGERAGRLHPRAHTMGRSQSPVHTALHPNEAGLCAACRLGKAAAAHEGEHARVVGQYIADEPLQPGRTGRVDQCRQQPFRQSAAPRPTWVSARSVASDSSRRALWKRSRRDVGDSARTKACRAAASSGRTRRRTVRAALAVLRVGIRRRAGIRRAVSAVSSGSGVDGAVFARSPPPVLWRPDPAPDNS
jgi:hypothetical protein